MQRYRVNVGLLVGLLVGALVIAGGGYGLYKFQRSRNATQFLSKADEAEAAGNLRAARGNLISYVRLRRDDFDTLERLTNLELEIAELRDAEPSERRRPPQALAQFVLLQPKNAGMRRKLVDELMKYGRFQDAGSHIATLLVSDPKNSELQAMRMTCMVRSGKSAEAITTGYKLIGYDQPTGQFDASTGVAADSPGVYQQLAVAIRGNQGDPALADAIIEQMIGVNPDLSEAYVARGQYRASYLPADQRAEAAGADYDKALELDPTNADALLAKAQLLMRDTSGAEEEGKANLDSAYALLTEAAKADTADWRAYELLTQLETKRGNPEAAIAHYDAGIAATGERFKLRLAFLKANYQVSQKDLDGAEETIATLTEMGVTSEMTDYVKARILFERDEWYRAAEELMRLRPAFENPLPRFVELNVTLALAFEQLGQFERALDAYNQLLQRVPSHAFAKAGRTRCTAKLNPQDIAETSQSAIDRLVRDELNKPRAEQDWGPVYARVEAFASSPLVAPGTADLLKAEIAVRRQKHEEARRLVTAVMKQNPDDVRVWRAGMRVIASDPERGPVAALKKLPALVEKFGDTPLLRLDKADFLIRVADENIAEQLMAIPQGIDDWEPSEQARLWKGLADRFLQLRDFEARQTALQKVADLTPNDLPTLLVLFQNAMESKDNDRIAEAQEGILRLVGSKKKATYLFTEASRLLWNFANGAADRSALDQADKLIEQGLLKRPDWNKLYETQALIALARNDKKAALKSFEQSVARGQPGGKPLLMHVSLLLEKRRYRDAAKLLERLPQGVPQRLLGRSYAEVLMNTGRVNEALESADRVVELGQENGATQLWYGRFLLRGTTTGDLSEERRAELREAAESALAKAVELSPNNSEAWLADVGLLIDNRKVSEAEAVLRRAQLTLPEDQQAALLARGYEWLGRWFDAEAVYRDQYQEKPDDLSTARALAAFYLSPRYPQPDKLAKATPLLNGIMQAADEDGGLAVDPTVLWARRTAAEILAQKNDYQSLLDAERLLRSNVVDGQMADGDRLMMARILASRPEPPSRVKAIRLFEEVQRNRVLGVRDALRLGQLYYTVSDWDECRSQMLETIARNPRVPAVRESYINMLLARGGSSDVKIASRQLKKLQEIAPNALSTRQLFVRVAVKLDKKEQAAQVIARMAPRDIKSAEPSTLVTLARLLTELGDLDRAEALYRAAAARQASSVLLLADFLGNYRDPVKAFELLEGVEGQLKSAAVIRTGMIIVRARRDDIGDAYDAIVDRWLEDALLEDPESVMLLRQKAELRDLQRRYDEAVAIYRKLLTLPELDGTNRAVVLNNLGYLLGLSARNRDAAEEAMGYVAEAVDILGPQADILDTRAVIHTTLEQYRDAIADIDLALTENKTASKFFHKARAHMLAGQRDEAVSAWDQAVELGLTRESVASAEQDIYDALADEIAATPAVALP
ncbi:MAG: tetratricopeptide repeat protein [Planctomycetota bacterium]